MDINIPSGWLEVDKKQFDYLLGNINTTTDAWGNGEYYEMCGKRIAARINRKFYIDPEVFKPL